MANGADKFEPIHNPYIVGKPIKDRAMFFGREEDFASIRQKVTGSKRAGLVVLCGTRRSGKTSILFQIMNGRLGDDFVPALIDMQAMTVENDLDFVIKLSEIIINAVGDPEISLEKDFLAQRSMGTFEAFQKLIAKIVQRLQGKKLILLFDEYEILESHIEKKLISASVLDVFSNWIDHEERVFIVFTGSDRIEERSAEYWGRFLSKAVFYQRISFLTRNDTMRLIHEPLRGIIDYEEGVPERIYELTAGQPFYTQVFCQALVDHLNEVREYRVTSEHLKEVTDLVIENPLPQMIFSWTSLTNLEKLSLSIVAELNKERVQPVQSSDVLSLARSERIGYEINPSSLNETLERLFQHDVLLKDAKQNAYWFRMGLWHLWIGRMHSIWQVVDEFKESAGELGEGIKPFVDRRPRIIALTAAGAALIIAVSAFVYFSRVGDGAPPGGWASLDSTQVTILTTPPGADIILGSAFLGKSPVRDRPVAATRALLQARLAGYREFADTLDLRSRKPEENLERSIALVEKTGSLRLTSSPAGAEVHLGGSLQTGKTPMTIEDLSVNRFYDLRMKLAGWNEAFIPNVAVFEDSVLTIHRDFNVSTQQVQIVSTPPGAAIHVDGKASGETPNFVTLSYGAHRIGLRRDGYAETRTDVTAPVEGDRVEFVLTKLPKGTLVLAIVPFADVYVNNENVGRERTRYVASLDPGKYTIRLSNPNYEPIEDQLEILPGDSTVRTYNFMTKARP
jgi:AAA+ ATPase superfamily predicted ATPase